MFRAFVAMTMARIMVTTFAYVKMDGKVNLAMNAFLTGLALTRIRTVPVTYPMNAFVLAKLMEMVSYKNCL